MKKRFLIIFTFFFTFLTYAAFSQESESEISEAAENASGAEIAATQETLPEEEEEITKTQESEETEKPEAPKITVADIDPSTEYLAKSGTSVNASAWSHIGDYFAVSWNNTTILFESETNNIAAIYSNTADNTINPFTDITKITFAPDDNTLLSVHNNNTAMVHSIGDSGSALITGTGDRIADAVYTGTSFRLIIPLDEKNLYDCTRQSGTGSFDLEKRLEFDKRIIALASNEEGGKIFVTFEDGSVNLIDTRTWQILGDMTAYTESEIYPAFAPDGIHFLNAQDEYTIFVSNIDDTTESHIIEEPDGFVYDAVFMPDGKSIVAATQSGYVRIYDIETGYVLYEFQLVDLDAAKTLSVSPDGEFVLVGTAMGYIYRWSLHGYEFDQEKKKYFDEEGNEYSPTGKLSVPYNSLNIMFDYSTLEKYYYGSFGFDVNYRNYALYPLYWGTGLRAGAAPSNDDYPYTYRYKGDVINNPWIYSGLWMINGGIAYYAPKLKLILFSEIGTGLAFHFMYNNEIQAAYMGKVYPSVVAEAILGVQYDWLRVSGGIMYDTNLGLTVRGSIGYSISFTHKRTSNLNNDESLSTQNTKNSEQDKEKKAEISTEAQHNDDSPSTQTAVKTEDL